MSKNRKASNLAATLIRRHYSARFRLSSFISDAFILQVGWAPKRLGSDLPEDSIWLQTVVRYKYTLQTVYPRTFALNHPHCLTSHSRMKSKVEGVFFKNNRVYCGSVSFRLVHIIAHLRKGWHLWCFGGAYSLDMTRTFVYLQLLNSSSYLHIVVSRMQTLFFRPIFVD